MSGFGAPPDKNKNENVKLKPKQQWDRYLALKDAESFQVAVCVEREESKSPTATEPKWLRVGNVRSKDNAHTEAAVFRQRSLIADHARRLFPLQVLPKDKLLFGYVQEDELAEIDSKVEMPADIEKIIGFVGDPDISGFYMKPSQGTIDKSSSGVAKMQQKIGEGAPAGFIKMKKKGGIGSD